MDASHLGYIIGAILGRLTSPEIFIPIIIGVIALRVWLRKRKTR